MDHFVRIVFDNLEEHSKLDESVFPNQNLLETINGKPVIEIPLARSLNEAESDEFADRLSAFMFENGYDNFDIEISVDDLNDDEVTKKW